jgi:hypothetical protein
MDTCLVFPLIQKNTEFLRANQDIVRAKLAHPAKKARKSRDLIWVAAT